jgi:class 3 adenylate cyclase
MDDPKRLTRSRRRSAVGETRKIAAILVSDVVGYSRLTGADETGFWRGSGRCAAT